MHAFDQNDGLDEMWCDNVDVYSETFETDKIALFAIPIKLLDEYIFAISIRNQDWIDGKFEDGNPQQDGFILSMERPIYIEKPSRPLKYEEKVMINEYLDIHWMELVETTRSACKEECFDCCEKDMGCYKFRNKPIPYKHPDFTLLKDDDVKLNIVTYYNYEPGHIKEHLKIN